MNHSPEVKSQIYSISGDFIKLPVSLKPQAKNNQVLGILNGRLKIAISAPPVDGRANKALVTFIAKLLSLKKQEVTIVSGITSHLKILHLPITTQAKLDVIISQYRI